jgi:hypothetical protein
MVTMVDPPGGWAYGFPQPLQGDYEKQLRDAGYPEADIPLALAHSWYHTTADLPVSEVKATYGIDVGQPGGDHTAFTEFYKDPATGKIVVHEMRIVEANPQRGECWAKDRFTGTASDGDDGA